MTLGTYTFAVFATHPPLVLKILEDNAHSLAFLIASLRPFASV